MTEVYINEIIRVTYKCNWKCRFCNVSKTNNFGEFDVSDKEIVYKILSLTKKYDSNQRKNLILSFSGGEPTLNKNLDKYIRLAKKIGVGSVEIQTNGTRLFKDFNYIFSLIDAGLDDIFLAQHSHDKTVNNKIGSYYSLDDFKNWIQFYKKNNLGSKIQICFNIVVNNYNILNILDYLQYLKEIEFFDLLNLEDNFSYKNTKRISFGLVQPNGYAYLNKDVLLKFDETQTKEIKKVINYCLENNIYPDFHYTSPPLCVLDTADFNLEHHRLKQLRKDEKNKNVNISNLESFKFLWKEKVKFDNCKNCKNNDICLGFYKNWINFVGKDYVEGIINKYI